MTWWKVMKVYLQLITLFTLPRAVDDTIRVPVNSSITLDQYPESESVSIGFEFNNNFKVSTLNTRLSLLQPQIITGP